MPTVRACWLYMSVNVNFKGYNLLVRYMYCVPCAMLQICILVFERVVAMSCYDDSLYAAFCVYTTTNHSFIMHLWWVVRTIGLIKLSQLNRNFLCRINYVRQRSRSRRGKFNSLAKWCKEIMCSFIEEVETLSICWFYAF